MKFVIRDDDLNYFSTPRDIIRWYKEIFEKQIPVGFSAIPFVKGGSDVYTTTFENQEYPISENISLKEYISSNSLIEILQHGYTHETKKGIYEYNQKKDLTEETLRGKKELEKIYPSVTVFVPPHDWINVNGVLAIEKAHMNIIRGRGAGLKNLIIRREYLSIFIHMLLFKIIHFYKKLIPAYPYILDFGLHKEACSYRLEDVDVFEGLTFAHKKNGVFVVVTHLHTLTQEKKDRLVQLVVKAKEYDAEFVYPHSLFQ